MDSFEKLYQEDQKHIRKWEKHYSDKEFYSINRNIRKKLQKLIRKKKNLTGREYFIAAIIIHHGFTISCSKNALDYIGKARKLGYNKQKWLVASITDRLLQLQGKPQKYGTQIVRTKYGIKQYKLDNSVSDKERIKLGLPPLKKLKAYLEKI